MPEHDVIVIGAGPAGEICSGKLAQEGLDVCLVERELVGGECAYTEATEAERSADGTFVLTLEGDDAITGDELLVAVGRKPHTDDLGLRSVGLAPGETIAVDDRMRVRNHESWLYAIGDVNGRALLTQAGKYQAQIATANIMNRDARAAWDGTDLAESLQAATVAIVGEVPLRRLAHAMPPFPARSEVWLELLGDRVP